VAGFTDGEGHIGITWNGKNPNFKVTLYQNAEQSWVLHEIQEFLESEGIDARFYAAKRKVDVRRPTVGYFLSVRRVADVQKFLQSAMPYLIVKRGAAIEVLKAIDKKAKTSPRTAAKLRAV